GAGAIQCVLSTPVWGGSMCSGNRLGGLWVWALAATMGMSVAADAQTAERVITIPLGVASNVQTGAHYFGVYIPTRFGGELRIKASSRQVVEMKLANGQKLTNGQDVGLDHHGWVTFKVEGAKQSYTVETTLIQVGQSLKKPWNFYYWPTKADSIHEPWAGG